MNKIIYWMDKNPWKVLLVFVILACCYKYVDEDFFNGYDIGQREAKAMPCLPLIGALNDKVRNNYINAIRDEGEERFRKAVQMAKDEKLEIILSPVEMYAFEKGYVSGWTQRFKTCIGE